MSRKNYYQLGQVDNRTIALMSIGENWNNIPDMNRWSDAVQVVDIKNITEDEFQSICGSAIEVNDLKYLPNAKVIVEENWKI
jgi:hypothetical protein